MTCQGIANKSSLFNPLTELPFHDVGNDKFPKVTVAWVDLLASSIFFQDIIESPEQTLENFLMKIHCVGTLSSHWRNDGMVKKKS